MTTSTVPPSGAATRWLTSAELRDAIRMSHTGILELRRQGVLRPGEHYILKGCGSQKAPLLWDINAVEATLRDRARALPETYDDGGQG